MAQYNNNIDVLYHTFFSTIMNDIWKSIHNYYFSVRGTLGVVID